MYTHTRLTLQFTALLTIGLCLTACSSRTSHIGAPWQWPGAAVTSGVSNAIYDARRARVKNYVGANLDALKLEARTNAGPIMNEAARLAEVPGARRADLFIQLHDNHATFFNKPTSEAAVEAVTVAFMVYSGR
jgi:hypothetical protein